MSLANKINELLTREATPERRGVWRWVSRIMPAGLTGLKIALAAALLVNAATDGGLLDDSMAELNAVLAARFGRGLSTENMAIALAAIVLFQDGGNRLMSILQRTLEVAMKPLLNERYQKGQEEGLEEGLERGMERGLEEGLEKGLEKGLEEKQREWEAWLMRRRESGEFAWDDEDPPPSNGDGRE